MGEETPRGGWERSFRAGCYDQKGRLAAGSEVLHLVSHGHALFAANGYWMDMRHPWYGATRSVAPWGQVLRLERKSDGWQVDTQFEGHLRVEALASVRFTTDHTGRRLQQPISLLLAAAYERDGRPGLSVFQRDDRSGQWSAKKILQGPVEARGVMNSPRVLRVYHDKKTGIDRVFLSAGVHGVWSGVFLNYAAQTIRWDPSPEWGPLPIRALSMTEIDRALHVSVGSKIYRRIDGDSPGYEIVVDLASHFPAKATAVVGGIRGMRTVVSPDGRGESLLMLWAAGANSAGCMVRIDVKPMQQARYGPVILEVCLDQRIESYLRGVPVRFVLGAYNEIFKLSRGTEHDAIQLFGVEAIIDDEAELVANSQRMGGQGFYAGAMIIIREGPERYRITEVNCYRLPADAPLIALRSIAQSPLARDGQQALFFGGYDANFYRGKDTAWVFSAPASAFTTKLPPAKDGC